MNDKSLDEEAAQEVWRQLAEKLIELLKPRTLFTFMFFGVTCYLILKQLEVPQLLNTLVSGAWGFWFGEQSAKRQMEALKNGNKNVSQV